MPAFHALLNNLPQEPDRGKKRKVWGRQSFGKAPKVLVLAPTRELAVQIEVCLQYIYINVDHFFLSMFKFTMMTTVKTIRLRRASFLVDADWIQQ